MTRVSLDRQTFFDPQSARGRKRANSPRNDGRSAASPGGQIRLEHDADDHRRAATGSSLADVILILSESEPDNDEPDKDESGNGESHNGESDDSDHNDFDDGDSDSSYPPIDKILATASTGGHPAKLTSAAGTGGSDSQKSELPTLASETLGPASEGIRDGSEEPSLGEMAELGQAAALTEMLAKAGAENGVASFPSPSSSKLSSPVSRQTDPSLTNGAENSSGTSLAPQRNDPACDIRLPDAPGSGPDEDVIDHRGSELRRTPQLSQEHMRCPEHPPVSPAITLQQRLSGSPRAVQQDEPAIQGSASGETRQTPRPGDATYGTTVVETSSATPPPVGPLHLYGPNVPAVPSPRLENNTQRGSVPRRVSVSNGDRGDEAMLPRIPSKASRGRAAVGRHHRRSVEDVNDNLDEMQDVRSDDDRGVRLPPRKCRRVSSRRNIGPRQVASDEEVPTSSQDNDSEWDTRPPQRKRRKSSLPKRAHTQVTREEMSSDPGNTGSRPVQPASPSPVQIPSEQQESVKALSAKFTEWLLGAAVVRSAVVDGVTTFQLQFKADHYCSKHRHHVPSSSQFDGGSKSRVKWRNSKPEPMTRVASTPGQDSLVSESDDDVQSTSPTKKVEWDVEKILKIRKRGRGHQARVKWVGFKKPTWEPLKNFLGTVALDDYEAQHGNIALGLDP